MGDMADDAIAEEMLFEGKCYEKVLMYFAYYAQDKFWITAKSEKIKIKALRDGHLLNCIRLLHKRRNGVLRATALYKALIEEAKSRGFKKPLQTFVYSEDEGHKITVKITRVIIVTPDLGDNQYEP